MSIHEKLDKLAVETKNNYEDRKTSYLGNITVSVDKIFRAPIVSYYTDLYNNLITKTGSEVKKQCILNNFNFPIRFYFPRSQLVKKVDKDNIHVIIMFNGLDESILPDHYKLYNRLGASFAYQGVWSILLPTPFHLARAAKNGAGKIQRPSKALRNHPWCLPINFIQSIHEFNYLIKLVKLEFDNIAEAEEFKDEDGLAIKVPTTEDKDFYSMYFGGKNIEFSILGYSLGGLRALSCFKSNTSLLKTCIVLNSGGTIDKLRLDRPIFMEKKIWFKEVVTPLTDPLNEKYKKEVQCFQKSKHHEAVDSILHGENVFSGRDVNKLILIAGGIDSLVEPNSIERLGSANHGLNILQIADLGHFIGDDPQFNRWYDRIITLLIGFFEDTEGEIVSRDSSLSLFSLFNYCCDNKLLKKVKELNSSTKRYHLIDVFNSFISEEDCEEFFSFIVKALNAYYEKIEDFTYSLEKWKEREKIYFGEIVCETLEYEYGSENYENIINIAKNPASDDPCGQTLLTKEIFSKTSINAVLMKQFNKYKEILEDGTTIGNDDLKNKILGLLNVKIVALGGTSGNTGAP